jgi:hypothetical protein
VCILDADDALLPTAVERAVAALADPAVAKAHWQLVEVDSDGSPTGALRPADRVGEGDLVQAIVQRGWEGYVWPPTSGNAWSRRFLEEVAPLPPRDADSADGYLCSLAPLFGRVARIEGPQGRYRVHGANRYASATFEARLARDVARAEHRRRAVVEYGGRRGLAIDPQRWRVTSWRSRLESAAADLRRLVPAGSSLIVVDQEQCGLGRSTTWRPVPFLERDGRYWGKPADDAQAIAELERMRTAGARWIAFLWPAFWWLDHYGEFRGHLEDHHQRRVQTNALVLYELR